MIMAKDSHGNYVKIEDIKQQDSFKGISPIDFKSNGDNLKNYRIYGNTAGGESVGDLITEGEHAGEYSVPVTVTNGTDTETTNLYLPEQIKMVGSEAEYVDYYSQTLHRVRKNLLQNTATSRTINGVTFTVNSDGSIVCDGQTSPSTAVLIFSEFLVPSGAYILTGCPNGGSETKTYKMLLFINNAWFANDIGSGANFTLTKTSTVSVRIDIYNGYTCDNLTFYPMIRKTDIEDDTYEPYIENTDLDVTIPALPTLTRTNVLSVNTNIKPSKIWGRLDDPIDIEYVKDNLGNVLFSKYYEIEGEPPLIFKAKRAGNLKNYRIYGNTETLTRSYSGTAPLSFPIVDGAVSNYRVYGNTVNGESVGDKTENIFDKTKANRIYGIARNADGTMNYNTQSSNYIDYYIPVKPNTKYIIKGKKSYVPSRLYFFDANKEWINRTDMYDNAISTIRFTTPSSCNFIQMQEDKNRQIDFVSLMIVEGSAVPENYIPYGYHILITNNSETANIYLDEPLRMVEDETEYVDYATQKQHRVRKNLLQNIATSQTRNGVTFTVNSDGSVTCNGTASATIDYRMVALNSYSLPAGNYRLTGAPPTANYSSYYLRAWYDSSGSVKGVIDIGNGTNFSLTDTTILLCAIIIAPQQALNNVTFYPMIRKAGIEDDTYEPYIENTEVDVTLPALPAQSSTNSLSVGTSVQPSSVAVDVSEVVSCGDKVTDNQSVNYGKYKIPVTLTANSAETTDIYLDEPLAKSGNNADYIDYATQKRHNSDGTESSIALSEIAVTAGSNTLSVETEVQPSDIYLKGKIEKKPKIYYKIYYYSQDGQTLLYTESVLKGSNGMYSGTPTKMADPQYTYTFAGWSSSTGQTTATPEVRNNIQNDKNVYAAFSRTLNTYTVYFYNESDTPIETVQNVPYGGTATYTGATPTKQGYSFTGWSPLPTNITADTSCYAQFEEDDMYESITDTWSEIIANVSNGTYSTKYHIGDTKKIDLGTEGEVIMTIVGIDTDDLADNSGKAPITWISKQLLKTLHRMNPSYEGTGALGGWEKTEMRSYLKETVKPLIPETVRNAIKPVKKYSRIYNVSGSAVNDVLTTEDVWIPSYKEVFGTGRETQGPTYSTAFPDDASCIKRKAGDSAAWWWWLRSAYYTYTFNYVRANGSYSNTFTNQTGGVALGFCLGAPTTYTVTYYSQDGQTVLSTETVEEGHDCTYSTVPTKESDTDFDYTFTGWSTTTNSTTATTGATEDIQQDTNLYAAFSKLLKGDTISDSWEEIIANCNNGTYASKYQVGDLKTINIGTEGPVQMEIVAIDTDDKADNSGKAAITWISKQLLNTARRMHSSSNSYAVWSTCELRGYLRGEFFSTLPTVVQNGIKEVTKYTSQRTGATDWATHSSTETIWIPSSKEIDNTVENNGPYYSCAARTTPWRKKENNMSSYWWLRTASIGVPGYNAGNYQGVMNYDKSINTNGDYATQLHKIAFGFCT